MELYNQIFRNNQKWAEERKASDAEFFDHLAEGQHPEILYIGCSDSRMTAEEMTGVNPGEMFVHRNVGNLVPNNDNSSASVIEYAVEQLHVRHIVVCGHYGCGGVKAAMQSAESGTLNSWLRNIRDVYRLHKTSLNAIKDEVERYDRLVELNVQEQCVNIIKMALWQKHFMSRKFPTVHGWVLDVKTGRLKDLQIDFSEILSSIRDIYDLGPSIYK